MNSGKLFKEFSFVQVYIDEVIIGSKKMEDHGKHLTLVFDRIKERGIMLKLENRVYGAQKIDVLGYVVSAETV